MAVHLRLISCEVLYREMCWAVARSPHRVDAEFLPKGLHDLGGAAMRERLQQVLDPIDGSQVDAILLGYGLCGNGIAGLVARTAPLVVPRAHDCIALLMGSRHRYQQYFEECPGTYFRSTGWLERAEGENQELLQISRTRTGHGQTLEGFIAKYGEENGRYLFEQFNAYRQSYRRLTYIATGLESDGGFEQRAREEAGKNGWQFECIAGNLSLFERLVSGDWEEHDFLTVSPGWRIIARADGDILDKERVL